MDEEQNSNALRRRIEKYSRIKNEKIKKNQAAHPIEQKSNILSQNNLSLQSKKIINNKSISDKNIPQNKNLNIYNSENDNFNPDNYIQNFYHSIEIITEGKSEKRKLDDFQNREIKDESDQKIICKFCYQGYPLDFISPCGCKGSIKYVHKGCLKLWRFRKNLKEIKNCEQCFEEYRLEEDIHFNVILLHLISISIVIGTVIAFNFFLNIFLESVAFVLDEILYENGFYYNRIDKHRKDKLLNLFGGTENQISGHTSTFNFFNFNGPDAFFVNGFQSYFNYLNIVQSTIVLITLYQILFSYTFFSTLNLFFTLWRLFQFNFKFDYFFMGLILFYYLKKFYDSVCGYVDRISFFMLNR